MSQMPFNPRTSVIESSPFINTNECNFAFFGFRLNEAEL